MSDCPYSAQNSCAPTSPVSFARLANESWIWGNARFIASKGLEFFQLCERRAGIVHTRCFLQPVYIVTDPEAIADVLVKHANCFDKPYVLRRLKVLFGEGLLTSNGEHWAYHRRMVQPAFRSEILPAFADFVGRNTVTMAEHWTEDAACDIYPDLADLAMKNVNQTMFGTCDDELAGIVRALARTCHELVGAIFSYGWLLPFLRPGPLKRQLNAQLDQLDAYLGRLIDQRRGGPPRSDFFGLLLGDKPGLPNRASILDESVTMLLAGHETSASALVWCLYLLATHPEHANALAAELSATLGGRAPSFHDLDRLPTLRGTLDETLRLYPPTHRIGRTVKKRVAIGGHEIPAGADVVMPQWAVHRSARWYEDPESFHPERWTPQFRQKLPRFAYFPFSGGPRTCVGSQMAWTETAVVLGFLAQRYTFTLCNAEPPVPREGLTLLPAGGLHVLMRRRALATAAVA